MGFRKLSLDLSRLHKREKNSRVTRDPAPHPCRCESPTLFRKCRICDETVRSKSRKLYEV